MKCKFCSKEFKKINLLSQHIKRKHNISIREINRIKNEKEFVDFVNNLKDYKIVEENFKYKNAKQKVEIEHTVCGTIWSVKISKFWGEGSRCPNKECFREKRVSHLRKVNMFEEFFSNEDYKILEPNFRYLNKKQRVKVQHKCGYRWEPVLDNLFRNKSVCPNCKHTKYKERTIKRLFETLLLEKDEFIMLNKENFKYVNTNQKISIKHLKCDTIFTPTIHNFLDANSRCPHCTNFSSNQEKEVLSFIKSLGVDSVENTKKVITPYELDIYVPEHNFAIEYNGLYWHSEERVGKKHHFEKTKACLEKNINLMHIFSDEWLNKQDIIKSMIRHRLKKPLRTIYARKCEIKEVSSKEAFEFFDKTHISGKSPSRKYFVLVYNNEIVAGLSLKKPIQKKHGYCLEISRFSTALNTHVPGAFSKLFKRAKRYAIDEGYESILSYADRRFGEGKVYKVNGFFDLGKTSSLDYWYTDGVVRHFRFKYRAKPGKTEKQVAEENNVHRIYGCGSNIYQLILS